MMTFIKNIRNENVDMSSDKQCFKKHCRRKFKVFEGRLILLEKFFKIYLSGP
jgi:hypothetical protein